MDIPLTDYEKEKLARLMRGLDWDDKVLFADMKGDYLHDQTFDRRKRLADENITFGLSMPYLTRFGIHVRNACREYVEESRSKPSPLGPAATTPRAINQQRVYDENKKRRFAATDKRPYYYSYDNAFGSEKFRILCIHNSVLTGGIFPKSETEARSMVEILNTAFTAGYRKASDHIMAFAQEMKDM